MENGSNIPYMIRIIWWPFIRTPPIRTNKNYGQDDVGQQSIDFYWESEQFLLGLSKYIAVLPYSSLNPIFITRIFFARNICQKCNFWYFSGMFKPHAQRKELDFTKDSTGYLRNSRNRSLLYNLGSQRRSLFWFFANIFKKFTILTTKKTSHKHPPQNDRIGSSLCFSIPIRATFFYNYYYFFPTVLISNRGNY